MIPNNQIATLSGTLEPQEEIPLSLDATSLPHLASVLSGLYSDIEMALIRELACNGMDSHAEAGQTEPVEITTPSPLHPYLTITDKGVGMSREDLIEVYSKYGASTKRKSNDYTGSLGLGSKSPLAYTPSFSVISVKDGIRITAMVELNAEGIGVIKILSQTPTTDHSGVTVQIPAKANNEFRRKAVRFARFVEKGRMMVDGKDCGSEFTKVTDDIYTFETDDYYGSDLIIMGNVPYPALMDLSGGLMGARHHVAAFVPMGSVNFTPNRESLMDTELTRATMVKVRDRFVEDSVKAMLDDVNAATSKADAFERKNRWHTEVPRLFNTLAATKAEPKYKGERIPLRFENINVVGTAADGTQTKYAWRSVVTFTPSRYGKKTVTRELVTLSDLAAELVVVNYTGSDRLATTSRRKTEKYLSDNNLSFDSIIFTSDSSAPTNGWVEATEVDWADIKAIKLPPPQRSQVSSGLSRNGGYDCYDLNTGRFVLSHNFTKQDEIIYFSPAEVVHQGGLRLEQSSLPAFVQKFRPKAKIVSVASNRMSKMEREVGRKHTHLIAAAREVFEAEVSNLTDADLMALHSQNSGGVPGKGIRILLRKGFDTKSIKDRQFATLIDGAKAPLSDRAKSLLDVAGTLNLRGMLNKATDSVDKEWGQAAETYGLLTHLTAYYDFRDFDLITEYINLKYESLASDDDV